jgi:hypothetical protein
MSVPSGMMADQKNSLMGKKSIIQVVELLPRKEDAGNLLALLEDTNKRVVEYNLG